MVNVSVIFPCLNEEKSIGQSIGKVQNIFNKHGFNGEIIVVDNNSTDNTSTIAKQFDVKYVFEPKRGYGNAYLSGLKHVNGDYLILGDPDSSYDFNEIPKFLFYLDKYDFVIGSRFKGEIKKGAMPVLNRYVGNPGIRLLLRIFFNIRLSEPSTGFIGMKKEILNKLQLKEPGMEFSSEILVKVKKENFTMKEIPIVYYKRDGKSKLNPFRDGFRHLRFILRTKFM